MEGRDEQFHRAGAIRGAFARDTVQFAAIAGRKDQRFLENSARTELFSGFARLFGSESNTLPKIDRGRLVIQSDKNDFHLRNAQRTTLIPCSHVCSEISVKMR